MNNSNNKSEAVKSFFDSTHLYLHKDFGVHVRADIARDLLGEKVTGKRVIDIGCGNGEVSLQFIDKVAKLDFLDISDKMLALVEQRVPAEYKNKVNFYNCDVESFEVIEQYDIVIAYGLVMHVNSPIKCVQKMSEMLKDGGLILTQYTNSKHAIARFNKSIRKPGYRLNDIHKELFMDLIKQTDLKVVKSFKYSWLVSGLGFLPTKWLYKFHKWTYTSKWASSMGMDDVFLLTK